MALWRRALAPEDEVEDVAQGGGVALVDFGVAALLARDCGELLVLDVEEPCMLAGGPELASLKLGVPAFGADAGCSVGGHD